MRFIEYSTARPSAIVALNKRLAVQKVGQSIPETGESNWPPGAGCSSFHQTRYLTVDDDEAVHGGYALRYQPFVLGGKSQIIANLRGVVAESDDTRIECVRDAVAREPLLYALGMGGLDRPLPMALATAGWSLRLLPFYFRIASGKQFLRNVRYLRTNIVKRIGLDLVAFSGLSSLAIRYVHSGIKQANARAARMTLEVVDSFDTWADDIWKETMSSYELAGVRDLGALRALYPDDDPQFVRLLFSMDYEPVGWAVCVGTKLKDHPQFGNMRIGSIVDAVVIPEHLPAAMAATAKFLTTLDVDLIMSNQSHQDYCNAMEQSAMRSGPSNMVLALSPALAEGLEPFDMKIALSLFNRSDGDGPFQS